ncbi:tail fiber assembly protein [Pseudomonas sp. GM30]|uniref:tail fiber assembly protein n=1 Tax=Pseudomonas sp. GM30 TaxID=1144328 RepID=UPI00026FD95A|nr:tail fiber assembly protein [Pseudomonas sp. GM30]EUB84873.1 tail assembly chaperone gp38 [Pseudomonas sp. GM30]
MEGFVITETSWAPYTESRGILDGETFVEEIPQWLIENLAKLDAERESRSLLSARMTVASDVIQPLQDDFDIEEISDENQAKLKAWKKYRSALGKTPERVGWPVTPDWPPLPEVGLA